MSRAEQAIAVPGWGGERVRRSAPAGARGGGARRPRLAPAPTAVQDAVSAALLVGGALALWGGFLAAVW